MSSSAGKVRISTATTAQIDSKIGEGRGIGDGEEIGGDGLIRLLQEGKQLPRIDLAVVSDTRMRDREHPAITYALRGVLGLELEVIRRGSDLHAGAFGGAVHDALQALCEIVASLHDADGRVAVSGFYDRVREVPA